MFAAILIALPVIHEASSLSVADKLHSPFASDCFKRISIGQRLLYYDVTRTVNKSTVKGCEEECNIYECTFFSFGISAGGNGTCELSTYRLISKRQATDYDLYQRTKECSEGKPTGYEEVCYRRMVSGRRLDERFIRHSLPCDTLEACQHQCSIEKHFKCHGFNIRWARQKSGGGICELSSIPTMYLDPTRDFRIDLEFDYYERDYSNKSPNCGIINEVYGSSVPNDNIDHNWKPKPFVPGGPYHGGDSYGPWSSGYGGPEHGPWGSHGYGSGSYMTNNPNRIPPPTYPTNNQVPGPYNDPGYRGSFYDYRSNEISYTRYGDKPHPYDPRTYYPDRRYSPYPHAPPPLPPPPSRTPTYIIIDSTNDRKSSRHESGPYRPGYHSPPVYGLSGPQSPVPGGHSSGFGSNHEKEICFQRIHVGYRVDPKFAKGFHMTPSILDCEAMCMQSPFKCTGYSYRYSNMDGGGPNCALADFSYANPKQNLLPDRSCDFYFKMPVCSPANRHEETECFLKTYSNQRITPDKIRRALLVRGVSDCELECLKSYHFTCRSFTFRYGPGVIGEPIENCFLSDWPVKEMHPTADYIHSPACEVYERGSYGHGCELDIGPPSIGPGFADIGYPMIHDKYHWNRQEMWKHFTVRGWPCRIGTECQLNREAGFWSCEVEGGDRGQWDYCCRPGHHCGFSKGYYYPWCYVGEAGPDQWRPCSEQFYPDFANRYSQRPGTISKPFNSNSFDSHNSYTPWNYGQEEYGPPSYWPVLYLYVEPPPNITESWTFEDPHHSPYYLEQHNDDDPKIQFRPSKNRFPYPKGIVLKIDVKDKPSASDPGYQAHKDDHHHPHIHPRYNYRKNLDTVERVPVNDLNYPYFVKHTCERESLKADNQTSSTSMPAVLNYTSGKRQLWNKEKSKEVIRDVEKIIEEQSKDSEEIEIDDKNVTLSIPKS